MDGEDRGRRRLLCWHGPAPDRIDAAVVTLDGDRLTAHGSSTCTAWTLTWRLETAAAWITRTLDVRVTTDSGYRVLSLRHDDGRWSGHRGEAAPAADVEMHPLQLPDLGGALDCDLGLCPMTNTMPILRQGLLDAAHAGEHRPATMRTAWVSVPELDVSVSEQHYAAAAPVIGGGAVIRFSADGFVSYVEVDSDGLVVNYPSIGRRLVG